MIKWWAGAELNCRHQDFQSVRTHQRRVTTEIDRQRRSEAFQIVSGFGEELQELLIASKFDCEVALQVAPRLAVRKGSRGPPTPTPPVWARALASPDIGSEKVGTDLEPH